MGKGDYGITPNVWRPSEVPPGLIGSDLGVGAQPISGAVTTTTVTEYDYPPTLGDSTIALPGWIVRESHTLTHTVTIPDSTTSTIVGDTQPPTTFGWRQHSPYMILLLRGLIDYTGASNTIFDSEWQRLNGDATYQANGGLSATLAAVTDVNFVYCWVGFVSPFSWTRLSAHMFLQKDVQGIQGQGQGLLNFNINAHGWYGTAADGLNNEKITGAALDATFGTKIRFLCRNNSNLGSFDVRPTKLEILTPPDGFDA